MVTIIQDPVSRRWGMKITEGIAGRVTTSKQDMAVRPLLEIYEWDAANEVLPFVAEFQKSMSEARHRVRKEGGIWMYEIGAQKGGVLYSEGGWMEQHECAEHLGYIEANCQGFPQVQANIKATNMNGKTKTERELAGIDRSLPEEAISIIQEAEANEITGAGWKD